MDKTNLLIYKSWIEAAIIKMRIKTKGLKKILETISKLLTKCN